MVYAKVAKPRKKLKTKTKIMLVIASIVFVFFLIDLYFVKFVNPVVLDYSSATVESLAVKSINASVTEVLSGTNAYADIVNILTDDNGNIQGITTNSQTINMLSNKLMELGQTRLEEICTQGVGVPIGNFTGIPLLVGRGANINVKIAPIGNINTEFFSKFSSCGINQTKHQIIVRLVSTIKLILPLKSSEIKINTDVIACESVIVGRVPEVYLNGDVISLN